MSWREVSADVGQDDVDRFTALLWECGCSGLQEDYRPGEAPPPRQPWDRGPAAPEPARRLLRAWFEGDAADRAREALLAEDPALQVTVGDVPDQDWENDWKRSFSPIQVSPRLVVAPPWDAPDGSILIEPGQGFGTGHHPTTLAALRALDAIAEPGLVALDVGSGSGILAIAAAKLGLTARGIDVEPEAVKDAERNAAANGVSVRFGTEPLARLRAPADVVLANVHAEVLVELSPHLLRLCRRHLVLAGILADREASVRAAFDPALGAPIRDQDGEWVCLRYEKTA